MKEILDTEAGISLAGNDFDMYCAILSAFIESSKSMQDKLSGYISEKDMNTYSIKAHGLKGNAKMLGAHKLAEKALTHEIHSKNQDFLFISSDFSDLIRIWNQTTECAVKYLAENQD